MDNSYKLNVFDKLNEFHVYINENKIVFMTVKYIFVFLLVGIEILIIVHQIDKNTPFFVIHTVTVLLPVVFAA